MRVEDHKKRLLYDVFLAFVTDISDLIVESIDDKVILEVEINGLPESRTRTNTRKRLIKIFGDLKRS